MTATRSMVRKEPNKTTLKALQDADKGKGKKFDSATALFKDLNI